MAAGTQAGFSNWNRRDFNSFVKAAEKHGRTALPEIAAEVDGKSEDDVRFLGYPCSCAQAFDPGCMHSSLDTTCKVVL